MRNWHMLNPKGIDELSMYICSSTSLTPSRELLLTVFIFEIFKMHSEIFVFLPIFEGCFQLVLLRY